MRVFRDLSISANAAEMAAAVAEMERSLPNGWSRDTGAEARSQAYPTLAKRVTFCFACKKDINRPAAVLILSQTDSDTFCVSNIIPTDQHQLEHAEYNGIFEEFYTRIFKPYADKAGLKYIATNAEASLEQWMDSDTANLLREFSTCANKGTGASHPNDRERWNAFVLAAHRSGSTIDPTTLARWLIETDDWSPTIAEQLALEYESGRELLNHAFAH